MKRELTLAETPDPIATHWLESTLTELGAERVGTDEGIAGSVDATWETWRLPDGAKLEVWSDNYTALSIRGEGSLIRRLGSELQEFRDRG